MDESQSYAPNAAADWVRANRMFANLGSLALGAGQDQNYASEDAYIGNPSGVAIIMDPYRGAAVYGTTNSVGEVGSTTDGQLVISPGLILLGAALLWLATRKG